MVQGYTLEDSPADESDRTRDEDDFDGTSSSLPEKSIANQEPQGAENPVAPEKQPRNLSNRPDTYNRKINSILAL